MMSLHSMLIVCITLHLRRYDDVPQVLIFNFAHVRRRSGEEERLCVHERLIMANLVTIFSSAQDHQFTSSVVILLKVILETRLPSFKLLQGIMFNVYLSCISSMSINNIVKNCLMIFLLVYTRKNDFNNASE